MIARNFLICLVLLAHTGVTCASSFDGRYQSRIGDLDADGKQDIYIQYAPRIVPIDFDGISIPIATSRAPTRELILKGNISGTFDLISDPSPEQKSTARAWPKVGLPLVRGDYNADGNIDIRVKGVGSAILGAVDPIVYAAPGAGSPASAITPLTNDKMQFVGDLSGWVRDSNYYHSGWRLTSITEYDGFSWPTYVCAGEEYPDISVLDSGTPDPIYGQPGGATNLPSNGDGCEFVGYYVWFNVLVYGYEFDASGFHSRAMTVARTLMNYRADESQDFTISSSHQSVLKQEFGTVFGVTFGTVGGISIPDQPVAPPLNWGWLRWIAAASPIVLQAILINIAIPNATADDDTFNLFHHYSFMSFASSIATTGLWAPVFLTQGPIMTGEQANQNLNLSGPVRDAVYFVQLPESWPLAGPRPVVGGGEGWMEWISADAIPPIYVSPPRPLAASGP